jgi:hypothetical protein
MADAGKEAGAARAAGEADEASEVGEPQDYWEKEEVTNLVAKFDAGSGPPGGGDGGQAMPMLVAVRVRPMWAKEEAAGEYNTVTVLEGKVVTVMDPWYDADLNPNRAKEKQYAFDVVFDEEVGQEEVYKQSARGLVDGVLDGYNSSVFAYGATGAGKTHTMLGSLDEPGVMVNTLHDMFVRMKDASFHEAKFKVTLSYMEIYNELIKDLLQPTSIDLKLNEDPARGMVVQGITEYGADSADEILELLHRGNMHRAVEPTAANQVSSRSHAVLQITVEQSEATAHVTGNVRIGKLSMVDLAGSERASKTDNTGQRLKEGANINRSLLALGNCITALADKNRKGHVPFRDSKMTRLLKDSLGGNCRTVMIANISPSHRQFEETVNTLKYANRAKNLKTQVARNVVSVSAHIAEYQRIIMELRNEVTDLKSALKQNAGPETDTTMHRKQRSLDYVDNLEKQHLQQLKDAIMSALAERRKLLSQLTDHSKALSEARAKDETPRADGDKGGDAAAQPPDSGAHAVLHAKLVEVRRLLQQNQQTVNEIISTAVQRISSTERLQLLQLLVRGKFLEVMNEEMSTELEMRRSLTQAAMSQGALPPALMNEAMMAESLYAEHRNSLDFHAKMSQMEMGGSLRAPSIAQLLDQNLVSPQQATASQNIGELVRPFTNHTQGPRGGGKSKVGGDVGGSGLADPSRSGAGSKGPLPSRINTGAGAGSSGQLTSPLAAAGSSSSQLLSGLIDDDATEEDRHSSTSNSERYINSASSSLQSSRGPTSQRQRDKALAGLHRRPGGRPHVRVGSSEDQRNPRQSPTGGDRGGPAVSQPPSTPSTSRPPSNSRILAPHQAKLSQPMQRVKRFKPPSNVPPSARLGTPQQGSASLPPIAGGRPPQAPPSAVQLASARAAAAARQAPRMQALGEAYGGPQMNRVPVPNLRAGGIQGGRHRRTSSQQSNSLNPAQLQTLQQKGFREGRGLPPAAPSARLAARLQGGPGPSIGAQPMRSL